MSAPAPRTALLEARLKGRLGAFALDAELALFGGVTALVGPSGGGKTTLLRCLAGLTRLEGVVRFRGETWQQGRTFVPAHVRPVGYVFQEASLFPHLSVQGNLLYGLKRTKAAARLGFEEVVELLELKPLLGRAPARLSGGERQRAAIGRALLAQPELLLMDEPVSSLDPAGKAEVVARLEHLGERLSIPVILVSHDPSDVARLAHRVLAMRDGRIVGPAQPSPASLEGLADEEIRGLALTALAAGLRPADR